MLKIKELRDEYNWTQEFLAKNLGISRQVLSNYENDINQPSPEMLVKLADFFQCSTDYLLGREDDFGNITVVNGAEPLPAAEREILATFRTLPPDLQRRAAAYLAKLGELAEEEKTTSPKLKNA